MYRLEWTATPVSWKIVDNQVHKAMGRSVKKLTRYFQNSAEKFLRGAPYGNPTVDENGGYIHYINQFMEDQRRD